MVVKTQYENLNIYYLCRPSAKRGQALSLWLKNIFCTIFDNELILIIRNTQQH